jgi:hypothetical protein
MTFCEYHYGCTKEDIEDKKLIDAYTFLLQSSKDLLQSLMRVHYYAMDTDRIKKVSSNINKLDKKIKKYNNLGEIMH